MATEINLTDLQNRQYKFRLYSIGTDFKAIPGLYAFARDTGTDYEILYIGETSNLKNRLCTSLKQHQAYQCAVTNGGATLFLVRAFDGPESDRLDLETSLRHSYDPLCNRQ